MRLEILIAAALMFAAPSFGETVAGLRTVDEFEGITDETERSVALFNEMLVVIEHPRCLNCHPVEGGPRQGTDMTPHEPPVIRGAADFGAPAMRCNTCHGTENMAFETGEGSIPGHAPWMLAPVEMGWIGRTPAEICAQLKNPETNGDRTLADLQEHNAEDGLVGWGWDPGEGREPAPGSQEIFGQLTQAWIDTGAVCPGS